MSIENFFKPIRRKIGVATLSLACVFALAWVATLSDIMEFPSLSLDLSTIDGEIQVHGQVWLSPIVPSINGDEFNWIIPYWAFVMPLTVLSACLLLWKPRGRTKTIPEPDQTEPEKCDV